MGASHRQRTMTSDERWAAIADARLDLARLLEGLTPAQWDQSSLCREWRVRDVAAHVAMTPAGEPSTGQIMMGLVRSRGDLWAFGRDIAIAWAERPTSEIVGTLRTGAPSRSMPRVTNEANVLLDVLVHTQDIAVPLGHEQPVPTAAGLESLRRIWTMGWPFHARKRLAGVSLVALDADVALGSGPRVEAPLSSLLLLCTAREVASVPHLEGPGRALLPR